MKIKKATALILCVVMVLLCSGCSLNFFSVESLMSPPAQSGKNGEVEEAFKRLMSEKTIQLRTPMSGDYQTAFVLFDVNSDGSEEAIVFYTDSSIDASVRLSFLECINDTWVISADIKGAGSGVYDVTFADMNNNGKYEILVGWSLYDSKASKIVSVYEVSDGDNGVFALNTIGTEYYNSKFVTDFNGDDKDDLVLIYLDDSGDVQRSYFRCFSLSESDSFVKYGDVKLDSHISQVSKIQFDIISVDTKKSKRVFIDCIKNETSMFTEMLYWDTDELKPVREERNPSTTTLRSSKVSCCDIDGDGLLEIPANTKLLGDEKLLTVKRGDMQYTFTMLEWLNTFGDKSEGNVRTLFNPIDLYLYRITRFNDVTVYYDTLKQSLKFCLWDSEEKLIKDELLSVSYRTENDTIEAEGKKLLKTESGTYYYEITNYGKDFGITDEGVKSSFIVIN
ncbi:MAG: hypothetical protein E7529_01860 [Ruminococcaceae bacterium]|nr:hypothetical protein [Oscillospiraceae bacterium]